MKRIPLSLTCDRCGAKVSMRPVEGVHTCDYCKHSFKIEPEDSARDASVSDPKPSTLPLLITAVVMLTMVGFGAAWIALGPLRESGETVFTVPPPVVTQARDARIGWDSVGGPPMAALIGGKEHILGRIRDHDNDGQLSIRVYDSATLEERWRTADLGTYSDAHRAVWYALAGGRVLVSDGRNTLRVYDLDDGEEVMSHRVTDRVEQLCALPGSHEVWVELVDKRNILFDAHTLSPVEANNRPEHCGRRLRQNGPDPTLARRRDIPRVEGLAPKRYFVEGDVSVLLGARTPGTPIPVAAGLSVGSREPSWSKPVIQVDSTSYRSSFEQFYSGLAGGRFVVVYGVGSKGWQVNALDARTGDPLWTVTLRPVFAVDNIDGFVVTKDFVYVVRTSSLDVLLASSGDLIGAVGNDSYED